MFHIRTSTAHGAVRWALLALAATLAALAFGAVSAQTAAADSFTCRGSAAKLDAVLGFGADSEPVVANAAENPCATDGDTLVTLPDALRGVVSGGVAEASTSVSATGANARGALRDASLLSLVAGGVGIDALSASAGYQCVNGAPVAQSDGQVTGLRLFGMPVADTSAPTTLDLTANLGIVGTVRIGSIALNQTTTTPTSVTRTAVEVSVSPDIDLGLLDLLGLDRAVSSLLRGVLGTHVVLGEARAGLAGSPCPPVTAPPDNPGGPQTGDETDPTLHPPVVDDGPPARTPLTDATVLYHAVDQGVTLECRLDGGTFGPCTGRSSYSGLSLGQHCFDVRARRGDRVGPTTRYCWTVTALPAGCVATYHHGYFIKAGNAALGRRQAVFHATTESADGRILLTSRSAPGVLRRVVYRLNGGQLARSANHVLEFRQLDRARSQTLQILFQGNGKRRSITRRFRYVNYVTLDCEGREVVDGIASRSTKVGGTRVTIKPEVPNEVRGTTKLRFFVQPARRHALRAVSFALDGRPVRVHLRSAVFTARQLKTNGSQTLTVRLVPKHGAARTVRIPFTTRET